MIYSVAVAVLALALGLGYAFGQTAPEPCATVRNQLAQYAIIIANLQVELADAKQAASAAMAAHAAEQRK